MEFSIDDKFIGGFMITAVFILCTMLGFGIYWEVTTSKYLQNCEKTNLIAKQNAQLITIYDCSNEVNNEN